MVTCETDTTEAELRRYLRFQCDGAVGMGEL